MTARNYIDRQLKGMERGIVATPNSREDLDDFAAHNRGSNDFLLTQMAVNYGYKIALENVREELENNTERNLLIMSMEAMVEQLRDAGDTERLQSLEQLLDRYKKAN